MRVYKRTATRKYLVKKMTPGEVFARHLRLYVQQTLLWMTGEFTNVISQVMGMTFRNVNTVLNTVLAGVGTFVWGFMPNAFETAMNAVRNIPSMMVNSLPNLRPYMPFMAQKIMEQTYVHTNTTTNTTINVNYDDVDTVNAEISKKLVEKVCDLVDNQMPGMGIWVKFFILNGYEVMKNNWMPTFLQWILPFLTSFLACCAMCCNFDKKKDMTISPPKEATGDTVVKTEESKLQRRGARGKSPAPKATKAS